MTFAHPAWLWALILLPLVALLEWRAARRADARIGRLVGPRTDPALLEQRLPGQRRLGSALRLAAGAALILGASGPEWGMELVRRSALGSEVVLVVDVSASMDVRDVPPSRLEESRREAIAVLDRLPGSKVGVVAFAGDAVRLCPLTLDRSAARLVLETLSSGTVSEPGSDLGRGLRAAARLLPPKRRGEQLILVWTDGEDLEAGAGAVLDEFATAGRRVFAIGVGTPTGDFVPVLDDLGRVVDVKRDEAGGPVRSRLDESLLQQLARRTRGAYFSAARPGGELQRLLGALRGIGRTDQGERLVERPVQRFGWFAAAAALLLAVDRARRRRRTPGLDGGRRRARGVAAATGVMLAAVLAADDARAQSDWAKGDRSYRRGRWAAAESLYARRAGTAGPPEVRVNRATAQARGGKSEVAREALRREMEAPRRAGQAAAYNLGTLEAEERKWDEALADLRAALERDPGDTDARFNYEWALRERERERQQSKAPQPPQPEPPQPQPSQSGPQPPQPQSPSGKAPPTPNPPPETGRGLDRQQAEQLLSSLQQLERMEQQRMRKVRVMRDRRGEGLVSRLPHGWSRPRGWIAAAWSVLWLGAASGASAQQVEARLDHPRLGVGETTTLRVVVRGSSGARPPEFDVPSGIRLLGSGRQQSFNWVNGRASSETEFRFELLTEAAGQFAIGPIVVAVGERTFRSGQITLEVVEGGGASSGAPAEPGPPGEIPATLRADIEPSRPYVGQEIILRVRLIQRAAFAEDPQYVPPTTTGFWADRGTPPESYYGDVGGERVLITETRTRLYPLAVGWTEIGEALASVAFLDRAGPMAWLRGGRRPVVLRSRPFTVEVRALPGEAPAGFTGGVGHFSVAWTADRARTSRDVPVTVRFDVQGRGNLPLIRPPAFADPAVDVFASTTRDSLPPGGSGRMRFQWTVLPRSEGVLELAAPDFAWFDPESGTYRRSTTGPLRIDVGPPLFTGSGAEAGFPRALFDRPARPGGRNARPWAAALAGLALAAAIGAWRHGHKRTSGPAASVAHGDALRAARGEGLWTEAAAAVDWLLQQGDAGAAPLRAAVDAHRFGGGSRDAEEVRAAVLDRVEAVRSADRPRRAQTVARGLLPLVAGAALVLASPWPGEERYARLAADGDRAARQGDQERAAAAWTALWKEAGPDPGVAARLAWMEMQRGGMGLAARWVLRGDLAGPRDPGVAWVGSRVREAGGLVGASGYRWPVSAGEWAGLAFAAALAAALLQRRRWPAMVVGLLALAAATVYPLQGSLAARGGQAVVLETVALEGTDVTLEPGQVVSIRATHAGRSSIEASRGTQGVVPEQTVGRIAEDGP